MKPLQHKRALFLPLLLCIALLTATCKKAIYVPPEGDTIHLQAGTTSIAPGETVMITITGVKASGHSMPDNTLVRLLADNGKFLDLEGNEIAAVRLIGGQAQANYQSDENFTGENVVITARSGAALVNPEQLVITITSVEITQLFITANPLKLPPAGGTTEIIVTAYNSKPEVVTGKKIFLETTAGTLTPPSPIITDTAGKITASLTTTEPASVTATYKEISKTIEIDVGVNEPPIASFEFSPQNPLVGDDIHFTSTSTDSDGTIESHHWTFGDGESSDEENPTYDFPNAKEGTEYQVVLTVTDDGGKKSSVAQTVTFALEENTPPTANFSFTPETPIVNDEIQFISLSTDEDGTIDSYEWDFGDGSTPDYKTKQNPRHTYEKSGVYAVTLKVTDNGNKSNSITIPITISKKDNQAPEAFFTYSPTNPRSEETVYFNAEGSTDPDGEDDIDRYEWDFGDGTEPKPEGKEVTHTYDVYEEKTFTVTLRVADKQGNEDLATAEITVLPTPVAKFTFSPEEPLTNETVIFDASSSEGDINAYLWTFEGVVESIRATRALVNRTYDTAGTFKVKLTVTDIKNRTSTTSRLITIKSPQSD